MERWPDVEPVPLLPCGDSGRGWWRPPARADRCGSTHDFGTGYARVDSAFDFDRLRGKQFSARATNLLGRHDAQPFRFCRTSPDHWHPRDVGERLIPVASIVGSVDGASQRFDRNFRPVSDPEPAPAGSVGPMREGEPLRPSKSGLGTVRTTYSTVTTGLQQRALWVATTSALMSLSGLRLELVVERTRSRYRESTVRLTLSVTLRLSRKYPQAIPRCRVPGRRLLGGFVDQPLFRRWPISTTPPRRRWSSQSCETPGPLCSRALRSGGAGRRYRLELQARQ